MTIYKAIIANIDEVLNSTLNYDDTLDYQLTTDDCDWLETAKSALEKQVPKKPYKEKGRLQNNYFCSVCRNYLGDERELKYAGLQPKYCQQCGQALDWSE